MKKLSELATAIKERRRVLKITQVDLAQISQVSLRSLKEIERGKANPTWTQVTKILLALGWDIKLVEVGK
jgi:predicted transcriptional regulator